MQTTFSPDDLASPDVIAYPYPAYHALRDESPVRYVRVRAGAAPGIDQPIRSWALLRHKDVVAAFRDTETFSSDVVDTLRVLPRFTLLHSDPPRHTQLRRLVNKAFTPRRVADLEPWIRRITSGLLDELPRGEAEVVRSFSIPLPMQVIATLIGIPPEDYSTFRAWSDAIITYAGIAPDERQRRLQAMRAYVGEVIEMRRKQPKDDLLTALVEAEVDGERLSDAEILGFCVTLLVAGNDTTTNLISNMLHILASRPELWQRAREDRSIVEPIIDETLRFESPAQRTSRVARRAVEVNGVKIAEGDLLDLFIGSANRDPAVIDDPDEFRIDRPPSPHIAFGHHIHYCLGAPLARVEAKIALEGMLDRFASIGVASEPRRQRRSLMPLGFESLPLVLR